MNKQKGSIAIEILVGVIIILAVGIFYFLKIIPLQQQVVLQPINMQPTTPIEPQTAASTSNSSQSQLSPTTQVGDGNALISLPNGHSISVKYNPSLLTVQNKLLGTTSDTIVLSFYDKNNQLQWTVQNANPEYFKITNNELLTGDGQYDITAHLKNNTEGDSVYQFVDMIGRDPGNGGYFITNGTVGTLVQWQLDGENFTGDEPLMPTVPLDPDTIILR